MSIVPETGIKKIRLLRRLDGTPVNLNTTKSANDIAKNLQPLNYNRKLVAQKVYYEKNPEHQSPLLKTERGPVKERLGVKQIRLKRNMPLGTNTSSILPRKRHFRARGYMNQSNPGKFRRNKLNFIYSAQDRIERIRRQQRNNSPIKLRRGNLLTVQVKNTNFSPSTNGSTGFSYPGYQKFKMILNPIIQDEIQEIQRENMDKSSGPLSPLTRITPVTTELPLTTRFALL